MSTLPDFSLKIVKKQVQSSDVGECTFLSEGIRNG